MKYYVIMILCTSGTKNLQGEESMKKKYMPAELEILLVEACDVITTSVVQPEDPEQGGEGGGTGGSTSGTGSGIGGGWNNAGWI